MYLVQEYVSSPSESHETEMYTLGIYTTLDKAIATCKRQINWQANTEYLIITFWKIDGWNAWHVVGSYYRESGFIPSTTADKDHYREDIAEFASKLLNGDPIALDMLSDMLKL